MPTTSTLERWQASLILAGISPTEAENITDALRLSRDFADAVSIKHGDHPLTYQVACDVIEKIDQAMGRA